MRKIVLVSILALFVLVAFVPLSTAEMAKEGTASIRYIYSCTRTRVPIDGNRVVVTYESQGVMISDSGESPFHNMFARNLGVIYLEKGVGRLEGYVISTDRDGDKTVVEIKGGQILPSPNPSSVAGKFIGGTGKFEGITGTLEYKRWYVEPAAETTHQAIATIKISWKLPESKQ